MAKAVPRSSSLSAAPPFAESIGLILPFERSLWQGLSRPTAPQSRAVDPQLVGGDHLIFENNAFVGTYFWLLSSLVFAAFV